MKILENGDAKLRIKTQELLEKIAEYLTKEIEDLELIYATIFNDRSNRVRLQLPRGSSIVMNEKIVKDIILSKLNLSERKSSANLEDVIFLEGEGSITISVFNKIYSLPRQVFISVNLYSYG